MIQTEAATWCPDRKTPLWVRLVGGRRYYDDGCVRAKWGEFDAKHWGIVFTVGGYDTAHLNIGLIRGQFFIRLPFLDRVICDDANTMDNPHWGVSWRWSQFESQIWLRWGRRSKMIEMPWCTHHVVTQHLRADGTWAEAPINNLRDGGEWIDWRDGAWSEDLPYHYMLDNGEVQHVTATVRRSRSEHRWEWFGRGPLSSWLRRVQPFGVKVFETIDIQFSEEVGSRRGSWKGGCVGCGYEMKPGEAPRHTLRRMQGERRFR